MEQHPVPQDITGFKFKLVGDMTLKQFGELAFGAIIAYLFYATNWPGFIKMPLTVIFGLLGFGLAFFPIEERPLDIWIVNFLKAIYRPTLYVWQKSSGALLYTTPPAITPAITTTNPSVTPIRVSSVQSSIPTTPVVQFPKTPDDTPPVRITPTPPPGPLSIEDLQNLRDQAQNPVKEIKKVVKIEPPQEPKIVTIDSLALSRDQKKQEEEKKTIDLTKQNNDLASQIETTKTKIQALQGMDTTQLQQQLSNLSAQREALGAQISGMQTAPQPEPMESQPAPVPFDEQGIRVVDKPTTRQATVSLTDIPNIINGLVVNDRNVPLDSAILIIKDKDGNSIRALKSNQVGQFIASTPLENGTYYLEFERPGYNFDTLEIELTGKLISPLEIKGKPV